MRKRFDQTLPRIPCATICFRVGEASSENSMILQFLSNRGIMPKPCSKFTADLSCVGDITATLSQLPCPIYGASRRCCSGTYKVWSQQQHWRSSVVGGISVWPGARCNAGALGPGGVCTPVTSKAKFCLSHLHVHVHMQAGSCAAGPISRSDQRR